MAKLFITGIDLTKNELLNAVIQNLAVAPTSPVPGQLYFNTVDNVIYVWGGSAWQDYSGEIKDVQGTLPITVTITDGVATIDINNATTILDGAMSAVDKTKLDASTPAATPSTLVERDAAGDVTVNRLVADDATINNAPTAGTDAVNKTYVDSLADGSLKQPEAYDPTVTGNYPLTYGGNAIVTGDSFRITADQLAIGDGTRDVNVEDLLIAITDAPSATVGTDWMVAESNRDQATENTKGVAELATQVETNAGLDDLRIVTPLKLATYVASQPSGATKFTTTFVGTGNPQVSTITHNLNTQEVIVSIRDGSNNEQVIVDVTCTGANTLDLAGRGTNGTTYYVTVIG